MNAIYEWLFVTSQGCLYLGFMLCENTKDDYDMSQDAREAMRVVFSVLTKRICMHKTKFLMNIFKYCLKIILNSMNLQIATQLIIMFNF